MIPIISSVIERMRKLWKDERAPRPRPKPIKPGPLPPPPPPKKPSGK